MNCGVYLILNLINNKIYVGSSAQIKHRFYNHKYHLNKNTHKNRYLQAAWNKYGEEAFEFKIIEVVYVLSQLIRKEQKWINLKQSYDRNKGYNLNIKADSALGVTRSEETKQRISQTLKDKGTVVSLKARLNLSKIMRYNQYSRKKIKWPCEDGSKCRCVICSKERQIYNKNYRMKMKQS